MSTAERLTIPDIRPMVGSDLDSVMEIEGAAFSTPWSRASFTSLLGRDDASLWVATVDGSVVGYAVVWYVLREAELGNLAVASDYRRRGLGRYLLDWVIEKVRGRGMERLYLEVRASNRGAQQLYERRGFLAVGVRRRYYRAPVEDARVMCLDLGAGE